MTSTKLKNLGRKLGEFGRCTGYVAVFMLFTLLFVGLLCMTTFFIVVLDNRIGIEPLPAKGDQQAPGYYESDFYQVLKLTNCKVVEPCIPVKGRTGRCFAQLSYIQIGGETVTGETIESFSSNSTWGGKVIGDNVPCYVDPYNPDKVNYAPITNARPKLFTVSMGLVGGGVGTILLTFILVAIITCICMKRRSKFTDEDLDRLMAHVNSEDDL